MAGLPVFGWLDLSRPWASWPRRWQWVSLAFAAGLLGAVLWAQWAWQSAALADSRQQLALLEARQTGLNSAARLGAAPADRASPALPDPSEWPEASPALDAWVRDSAQQAALGNGVVLQQLSIALPEAAASGSEAGGASGGGRSPAPYARLTVRARGAYPALKAWQGAMQALMPSLAVEGFHWQAAPNDGSGMLMADWSWRLWVRPPSMAPVAPVAGLSAAVAPVWRPGLRAASRDPFGMVVVAAAAPVSRVSVEPPPPVSAPVAPMAPPSPPLQWTTLGRLVGPDGRQRLSGHWGNEGEVVTLGEGDTSPAGHAVVAITATELALEHPATKARLRFPLPAPPRFETR